MLAVDKSLIVVFLILWLLVTVLNRIFFNPLRKIMGEREAKIERNQKAANEATESFEEKSLKIEEQLEAAQRMAQEAREKFEKEGIKEKERILEEVRAECRNQVEGAKKQLKRQLERLKKELESSSSRLAKRIEQRLLN